MRTTRSLANLAVVAVLAALPAAAFAQHHGGGGSHGSGDHAQTGTAHGGHMAGAGHVAGMGHMAGMGRMAGMGMAGGGHGQHAATAQQPARPRGSQVVPIEVTGEGFVPASATVKAGRPVTLVVTRRTERTCATDIVVKDHGVNQPLPLGQAVEVTFTPRKAGPVRYACGMDMIAGVLNVE